MHDYEAQAQAFSEQIEAELEDGRLNFPTALDVSLRIKRMADDPNSSLDDIANVVKAEPVLSAKAVRMANAVMLNPYGAQIADVGTAVKRIGLAALRCLAFAVSAEQLAQDHRSKHMRLIASGLWMHSVDVASWSYAFAHQLRTVAPDRAMFAGMMVDIGQFFLLARASSYPALEENLERFAEFVEVWSEPVGRAIMEAFELPEEVLDAFEYENPYGGTWPPATLGDILFVASLAAESPNPFDSVLGVQRRPEMLENCIAGIEADKFEELVNQAREMRQAMLATVCG